MRVGGEQGLLACSQTPGLLEKPNGNTSPHDTGLAAAYVRAGVDTWKIAIKLPNHSLEDLRLLPPRQSRQHLLDIAQVRHGIPLFIVADDRRYLPSYCE